MSCCVVADLGSLRQFEIAYGPGHHNVEELVFALSLLMTDRLRGCRSVRGRLCGLHSVFREMKYLVLPVSTSLQLCPRCCHLANSTKHDVV